VLSKTVGIPQGIQTRESIPEANADSAPKDRFFSGNAGLLDERSLWKKEKDLESES
jgi:hypothetical protein